MQVEVRVSHISPKTGEIWGTLWSVAGTDPKKSQPFGMTILWDNRKNNHLLSDFFSWKRIITVCHLD
jgi:hypothetical protein